MDQNDGIEDRKELSLGQAMKAIYIDSGVALRAYLQKNMKKRMVKQEGYPSALFRRPRDFDEAHLSKRMVEQEGYPSPPLLLPEVEALR